MKKILYVLLFSLSALLSKAQIPVTDGANLAQSIADYSLQLLNGGATIENTLNTFEETKKVFNQGKEYYDALKNVHHLIKNGRKVQESVVLSVKIVDNYVQTVKKISGDKNFTNEQIQVFNRQQSSVMKAVSGLISDIDNVVLNTGMSLTDKDRLDAVDKFHRRVVSLYNKSHGLNMQMIGESESINQRKALKRLERELLR